MTPSPIKITDKKQDETEAWALVEALCREDCYIAVGVCLIALGLCTVLGTTPGWGATALRMVYGWAFGWYLGKFSKSLGTLRFIKDNGFLNPPKSQ